MGEVFRYLGKLIELGRPYSLAVALPAGR